MSCSDIKTISSYSAVLLDELIKRGEMQCHLSFVPPIIRIDPFTGAKSQMNTILLITRQGVVVVTDHWMESLFEFLNVAQADSV